MKVYYSHPMSWYGTDREKDDLAVLIAHTPINTEIINPANVKLEVSGAEAMRVFLDMVVDADAIAYRTFDDDFIGAGVAQEVLVAAIHGKQIWRMLDLTRDKGPMMFAQQGLRAAFGPKVLTIVQTRDRIRRGVM